jgi:uncharacterized protein
MTYDPAKRRSNKRKHKIDLADCEAAFNAPMLTREDASQNHGEQRLISLAGYRVGSSYWYGRIARTVPD